MNVTSNISVCVLAFIVVTVGVLLMTGKVKLTRTGKQKQTGRVPGPILWPCPKCGKEVNKNQVLDHYCEVEIS